jgi:hypothetical protein
MMENVEREVVRGNDTADQLAEIADGLREIFENITPKYRRYEEDDLSWLKTEGGLAQKCASALNVCVSATKESTTTLFRQLGRDAE